MYYNLFLILISLFLVLFPTCKKPTEPPPPNGNSKPDTTSHAFQFETFLLGDGAGSVLYDVAIVNDTLIYAVGEINKKDSTGEWENPPYNFARWNGKDWTLERILYNYQGQLVYVALRSVFALGLNDIWIAGNGLMHGDGTSFTPIEIPVQVWGPALVTKIWASISTGVYIVGEGGRIARYSNGTWQKLESGTETHINDVYGALKSTQGQEEIYCAVTDFFEPKDKMVLRVVGQQVDSISWEPPRDIFSVWVHRDSPLYAGGGGLWEKSDGQWRQIDLRTNSAIGSIRGNAPNDIVVVGAFGLLAHYNGASWRVLFDPIDGSYVSVATRGDTIIAVGAASQRAIAIIGLRPQETE